MSIRVCVRMVYNLLHDCPLSFYLCSSSLDSSLVGVHLWWTFRYGSYNSPPISFPSIFFQLPGNIADLLSDSFFILCITIKITRPGDRNQTRKLSSKQPRFARRLLDFSASRFEICNAWRVQPPICCANSYGIILSLPTTPARIPFYHFATHSSCCDNYLRAFI